MMPERQSMDIQTAVYGYTNGNLWIYEWQSMDIQTAIHRYTNGNPWIYEWQSIDIRTAIYRYLKRTSQISETRTLHQAAFISIKNIFLNSLYPWALLVIPLPVFYNPFIWSKVTINAQKS